MTEQLLQFVWQFRYYNSTALQTSAGEPLEILHPGTLNTNQGPDFLNAKIKCGAMLLAGHIEVHVNASEWADHRHSLDKNYNNVILHVVLNEDRKLELAFPVLELHDRISVMLLSQYTRMMESQRFIPCAEHIHRFDKTGFVMWRERMLIERLQEKGKYMLFLLEQNNGDWENSFWQLLARNFGARVNSDAFEETARKLPVNLLSKHRLQIIQLEALLLGCAGLLDRQFSEAYPLMLQKEFSFLKRKYLLPETHIAVHFLRMRPANFPSVRLAQLASLVQQGAHLFAKIKDASSPAEVEKYFNVTANDYWHYHYRFDEVSAFKKKNLGKQMTQNLVVNTVLPALYAYGWFHNADLYKDKALQWAEQIPAEKNVITGGFSSLGFDIRSAADSQALIQLKNKYCMEKRCLQCAIGNGILKKL